MFFFQIQCGIFSYSFLHINEHSLAHANSSKTSALKFMIQTKSFRAYQYDLQQKNLQYLSHVQIVAFMPKEYLTQNFTSFDQFQTFIHIHSNIEPNELVEMPQTLSRVE